jgi:hypothetical protein
MATKGELMGKHARIGLLLGASACLLAAMVDWVVEELNQHGNPSAGKLARSSPWASAGSQRLRGGPLGIAGEVVSLLLLTGGIVMTAYHLPSDLPAQE